MELIETKNSDKVIIVKCRSPEDKVKDDINIYDQIKICMAFFGKPFNSKSKIIFKDFYKIIRGETLGVYFSIR